MAFTLLFGTSLGHGPASHAMLAMGKGCYRASEWPISEHGRHTPASPGEVLPSKGHTASHFSAAVLHRGRPLAPRFLHPATPAALRSR